MRSDKKKWKQLSQAAPVGLLMDTLGTVLNLASLAVSSGCHRQCLCTKFFSRFISCRHWYRCVLRSEKVLSRQTSVTRIQIPL